MDIQRRCSFFTAEQEGRSVVPHVECYPLLRDWLLSGTCHGAGYMLLLHVVLVPSRKRLVAKRRLSWRRIYACVECDACSFAVAKTWNPAKLGLSQGGSQAAMLVEVSHLALFSLLFFFCRK